VKSLVERMPGLTLPTRSILKWIAWMIHQVMFGPTVTLSGVIASVMFSLASGCRRFDKVQLCSGQFLPISSSNAVGS